MAIVCQCSSDSVHCGINTDGTVDSASVLSSSQICSGQSTVHVFFLALRSAVDSASILSSSQICCGQRMYSFLLSDLQWTLHVFFLALRSGTTYL